ncbi:MAG TPA: hypothetical protein VN031_04015 [Candidatus Microsaccharimonas sp.]|nr:hypothetical protein [Candidatus Microsaccharimonas sp.]
MKQKDIALIIVIIFFSGVISFFISGKIFVTPSNREQKVQTVDVIDSSFPTPSDKYFNKDSIDPAQLVRISANNNQNPFNSPTPTQ